MLFSFVLREKRLSLFLKLMSEASATAEAQTSTIDRMKLNGTVRLKSNLQPGCLRGGAAPL